jgi:alpha-N-arabinofuranosidase
MIDQARIENKVPPTVPRQKICFDEWNVWDPTRAPGEQGAEEKYTLSDALAVAVWLNVFIRQAKYIGMANIAQSVNVISPLMTSSKGIQKQTTWWPLLLFSKYMRGSSLAVHVRCGSYDGETEPSWIRGTVETPWLDVAAAIDSKGTVSLAVVNISEKKDCEVEVQGIPSGARVTVEQMRGKSKGEVDVKSQEVKISTEEGDWQTDKPFRFPKASLTILRWKS